MRIRETELRKIIAECIAETFQEYETLPPYEEWCQNIEKDAYNRLHAGSKCMWKTRGRVFIDAKGHAVSHLGYNLMSDVLKRVDLTKTDEAGYLQQEVVFPYPVGYDECVETTDDDDIIYMRRQQRQNVSRFVLNREPPLTNVVMIAMKRIGDTGKRWLVFTAHTGKKGGLEPWDSKATDKDAEFWKTHALTARNQYTKDDDEGDTGYWQRTNVAESVDTLRKLIEEMIREEEYATNMTVGTFRNIGEAQAFLSYLRKKYGLTKYDSYINGTSVIVTIEKSNTNDAYFYDLVNAMKQERDNMQNRYKQVNESRLRKIVSESLKKVLREQLR